MATNVNSAFNEFLNNEVNISKTDSDNAKSSRDYLISQIINISKNSSFLKLSSQYNCYFGSFSRKTKICVLDDVDILLGLDGSGLVLDGNQWDNLSIVLKDDCQDRNLINLSDSHQYYYGQIFKRVLNSNKVKNKLVSGLSSIQQYEKADIHARGEAVTLKLKSYTWNFDIVPAFYCDGDDNNPYYVIPNGKGGWKKTNPKIEQKRITAANIKFNNTVLKTVRLIKYWNKYGKMPSITSYVLETIVLDYFDTANHCTIKDGKTVDYPDVHFRDALKYIRDHIFSSVNDSKRIQGNINDLTYEQKNKIYNRANSDYIKAYNAVKAEVVENDNKKSINIWRDIFGDEFPKYE